MLHGQGAKKTGGMGRRLKFLFFNFFFVNRFYCSFFYSVLPSSLSNAGLHFHVIHPHLIIQHKVSFSSRFISFFLFQKIKGTTNKQPKKMTLHA